MQRNFLYRELRLLLLNRKIYFFTIPKSFKWSAALRVTDLVVKSAQPIYLNRIYVPPYMPCLDVSKDQERGFLYHYISSNYRGWEVLPHLKIQVIPLEQRVRITDPNGLTLEYILKNGKTTIEESHLALSNTKGDTPIPMGNLSLQFP